MCKSKLYIFAWLVFVCMVGIESFSVQVLNMDNQTYTGELLQFDEKTESLWIRDHKKKKISLSCREIVQVVCQKSFQSVSFTSVLFLYDGSKIYGEIVDGNDSEVEVNSFSLGKIRRKIEQIREIHFKPNLAPLFGMDRSKDILCFVGGDQMVGVVENISKGYVEFQHPRLGSRREYFDKLERIIFAQLEESSSFPSSKSLLATFIACDQSELSGKILRLQDDVVYLQTQDGYKVSISLQNIQLFFFQGGKFVYVSDLPPERYSVKYTHCFPNSTNIYSPKFNKNFEGDSMAIAGQSFFKGIGVLPRTEIIIFLNNEFQRFQSHIGIDDKVLKELQNGQYILGGSAVFQVWLDGEKKFDSTILQYSEIQQVDIPVKGCKKLTLTVDFGKFPMGKNLANWAGARLIK